MKAFIKNLDEVGIKDVPEVGGKNASLGEMIQKLESKGINIPGGFVVTATAYRYFLDKTGLKKFIKINLKGLDTKNLHDLEKRAKLIREAIRFKNFPKDLEEDIAKAYAEMEKKYGKNTDVAVRSSATAEDLPGASFAGEHETYLNIRGADEVLKATKSAMASLFTDRAISYRVDKGFDHFRVALSVGVQKMVRSDLDSSGVIFTLDTESGFKDLIIINGSWGLGEMIVQGEVTPDEFLVFKPKLAEQRGLHADLRRDISRQSASSQRQSALVPIIDKRLGVKNRKMIYGEASGTGGRRRRTTSGEPRRTIKNTKIVSTSKKEKENFILNDGEILKLARWAVLIEEHYTKKHKKWTPMDLEWAKDGKTGKLFIVQARPETIHAGRDYSKIKEYKLENPKSAFAKQIPGESIRNSKLLVRGASVGSKIAAGKAHIILDTKDIHKFKAGEILITDMTDPNWEPVMKIASAIVTDKGGRTSHAAIVSRELGIPCVVGTENATRKIKTGEMVTVDCSGSDGLVYSGVLKFKIVEHNIKKIPRPKTKITMNIATPDTAFEKSFLPNDGVGLAREEFIIASEVGIHPMALVEFNKLNARKNAERDAEKRGRLKKIIKEIEKGTIGYNDKAQFYIDKLAYGIAKIGAAFYPKEVIVRFSDFKTNEYRTLIGGELYEPQEENPMIGWRGASRYYHPDFAPAFVLEIKAIKKVREEMGLDNVQIMVPFCRTAEEGQKVLAIMVKQGLFRGTTRKLTRNYAEKSQRESALKAYVMAEIPSNVILAEEFLKIFDGMSIGSNDLTQLAVGIDRDAGGQIKGIADERDESVKKLIAETIRKCRKAKKYVGICGDAPSTFSEFAKFLVEEGIESMSLNPDAIIKTTEMVYKIERAMSRRK